MVKKVITIKDIKKGTQFCEPSAKSPRNEIMTVVDIKYNPRVGEPVKDMWGGAVWSEPLATVYAVGEITKERRGYSVQSEDYNLADWLTFIDTPEDRINAIYADRRYWATIELKRHFPEILKALQELANYPAQFQKDKKMNKLAKTIHTAYIYYCGVAIEEEKAKK